MALGSKAVPNLIQGVSQQAPQQRRDTQCEEQLDCINSPVEGCVARPGADLVKFLAGANFSDAFFYDLHRGIEEHYLVVVLQGDLKVFDLADGTECSVAFPNGKSYLGGAGFPKDRFTATTVDDFTFIANVATTPNMAGTTSPSRPQEALFHFRAGSFRTRYQLALIYNNNVYTWTYTTPSGSDPLHEEFIKSNQIAATFYRAMTGNPAPVTTSGASVTANNRGVGASHPGAINGSDQGQIVGPTTATSLGFTVQIHGNVLRVSRASGSFEIDVADGAGGAHLIGIKDSVQSFSDLPAIGFDGFVTRVKGDSRSQEDDFWVRFTQGTTPTQGIWEEVVKPNTQISLNAATMPHQLVNTGFRTFRFEQAPWGQRVAGDGVTNAKTPSFVGKPIQDIMFDHRRLCIIHEGGGVWSKNNNPYVFFPDTVQTKLDTAPIDVLISGTRFVALLRKPLQTDESTFLWAQKAQFRVASNLERFTEETVEAKPSTNYEFAERASFALVGRSVYFASEPGEFTTVRDLTILDGRPRGHTDITAHAAKYVPKGVRHMAASDTLGMLFIQTEGAPSHLYVYNWLLDREERVQSAWNTWRLPHTSTLLWLTADSSDVFLVVQRSEGVAILKVDISQDQKDPGGDYLTRLDFKVNELACSTAYNAETDETTITVPYRMPEADLDLTAVKVVVRVDKDGGFSRGREFKVLSVTNSTIVVEGDARDYQFYVGFTISAEREESPFYLRSEELGTKLVERLQVAYFILTHARTGYYRVEVEIGDKTQIYPFEGRIIGDTDNELDKVVIADGHLKVPIACVNTGYRLRLINDSFLPSAWQTAEYHYDATLRAVSQGRGR